MTNTLLPVTFTFISVLAILMIPMTGWVGVRRDKVGTLRGDGGDPDKVYDFWDHFADVMSRDAVERFIELTHERYRARFGALFGTLRALGADRVDGIERGTDRGVARDPTARTYGSLAEYQGPVLGVMG